MYLFDELRTIKATDRGRSYFVLLLCAFWCNACFLDFGTVVIDKILHIVGSRDIIKPLVFVYLTIKSWQYLQVHISSRNWVFFIVASIIYLANFVFYSENEEFLLRYFPNYFYALIFFFLGISINIDQDKDYLYYASILNLVSSSFYNLIYTHSTGYSGNALELGDSIHDMPQAYYVLPSVIYITWIAFERFHIGDIFKFSVFSSIALSVLGFLLESSFGTRGPIVCYISFIVLYVLLVMETKHPWFYRSLTLILSIAAYSFLNEFLIIMAGLTSALGMSDRIFTLALEGTFSQGEDSADQRWMMINTIRNELSQNDMSALFGHGFTGFWDKLGGYPHNVIYDLVLTFGLVLGGAFIVILILILVKAYIKNRNHSFRGFLIVILACGFIKLLISSTFIAEPFFFMLIGYCINNYRTNDRLLIYK